MDVAVFGASFAAGFASGQTTANNFAIAYPRLVADKMNAERFYNFSQPARPVSSLKEDVIDFVEKYKEVNKTTEDLFILGECADPTYLRIPTVMGKNNKVYKPTMLLKDALTGGDYIYKYCEILDYTNIINSPAEVFKIKELSQEEIKVIITPETIAKVKKHVTDILPNLDTLGQNSYNIMLDALDQLCILVSYLRQRKVKYVLYWIFANAGASEQKLKLIDPVKFNDCFDVRFMNPETATLTNLILPNKDLMGEFDRHPSEAGHKVIADFLYDYIMKFNLLEDITHERPII